MRVNPLLRLAFATSSSFPFPSPSPISSKFPTLSPLLLSPSLTNRSYKTTTTTLQSKMSDEQTKATQTQPPPASPAPLVTIFSKIVAGEIPCKKVYEDSTCLAFHDVAPQAPVHIILIPKDPTSLSQLSTSTVLQQNLLGHMMLKAGEIGREHCPKGFRIVVNDGVEGCQSVYHLHLHVLGGKQLGWPPTGN